VAAAPEIVVAEDAPALAADVARRALAALAAAQARHGRAVLALTAGSIMEQVWQAIADSAGAGTPGTDSPGADSAGAGTPGAGTPGADSQGAGSVDWGRVDVVWADERFVPAASADRNDGPAQRILFGHQPFAAARQLSMPASDGPHPDLDEAARWYAGQLAGLERPHVVLLGLGPDGHCASLFPNHPGTLVAGSTVIGVRNSPKPPPERLSFTFDLLDEAAEIWFVASGSGKADAVALAHSGASREQVPSAGPRGRDRTLWLLDRDAAALL